MFAARDKCGDLYLFINAPKRSEEAWVTIEDSMQIDTNLFPFLSWKDNPLEVDIIISREKALLEREAGRVTMLEAKYSSLTYFIDRFNSLPWYKRIFKKI